MLILLTFICGVVNAKMIRDSIFISNMFLTNSAIQVLSNSFNPGRSVDSFTNKDNLILYTADIGVINPTKKRYFVEVICVDSKGNIVLKGAVRRTLSGFSRRVEGDIIKGYTQTLGMDPKVGAMVSDQLAPLKNGENYFIKLYFEHKLIGVTRFSYSVIK